MCPLRFGLTAATALFTLTAVPAFGADLTLSVFVAPNSGPATQNCGVTGPLTSAAAPVSLDNTCFRNDVGTASGSAIAAAGHVGSSAHADSHNGDSLSAGIGANAIYRDFVTFHSGTPGQQFASVSANLLLDGVFEADGPVAGGFLELFVIISNAQIRLRVLDGGVTENAFVFDSGQVGPQTQLLMHTPFITVPLDSPVVFELNLQTSAFASGPGSHGAADFRQNSFKLASEAFTLPAGVTVNAGSYLVDNHYADPLAPVPEPAGWALMLAGLGWVAARRRVTSGR